MKIWRAVLLSCVVGMAGFVGGVWFIGSGVGFQLVRLPPVPPAARVVPPAAATRVAPASRPRVQAVGVPAAANFSASSGGLGRPAERGDLLPSPGCTWEVEPREFLADQEWHRSNPDRLLVGIPSCEPKTGRFRSSLVQWTHPPRAPIPLRLVLFDAAGNRFAARVVPTGKSSGSIGSIEYTQHRWDELAPVDPPGPAYLGVERVVPDSDRRAADAARREARERGIALLPPPRLGEPFAFDLPTLDGGRARSADFRGRAVLVVLVGPAARGSAPLPRLREEFPAADLAVVGVSFAAEAAEVPAAFAPLGDGEVALVHVPNDPTARRLWREGAEASTLPAYWIIDRAGVLRFQAQWPDLADRLAIALGRPTRRGRFEAFVRDGKGGRDVQRQAEQLPPGPAAPAQPPSAGPAKG